MSADTLNNPDVIVVGAGHNTLTTAADLSANGLGVLALEKNAIPGGGQISKQVTLPGFIHDTHATAVVHLQCHPLLKTTNWASRRSSASNSSIPVRAS